MDFFLAYPISGQTRLWKQMQEGETINLITQQMTFETIDTIIYVLLARKRKHAVLVLQVDVKGSRSMIACWHAGMYRS